MPSTLPVTVLSQRRWPGLVVGACLWEGHFTMEWLFWLTVMG